MKDAAEKIMAKNPKIRITIAAGGSGVGVQKVGEGLVHIGNTGRALTKEEIEKYGLKSFAFAIDGVAVAVNPKNRVSGLTSDQVKGIFAGKITNWKDVGGDDAPIHLFTRDEASGTREVFWEKLLQKGPVASSANVVASNGAMKVALSQDPLAIGYLGIGHVDKTVKAITLDGAVPTQEKRHQRYVQSHQEALHEYQGRPVSSRKGFHRLHSGTGRCRDCQEARIHPLAVIVRWRHW